MCVWGGGGGGGGGGRGGGGVGGEGWVEHKYPRHITIPIKNEPLQIFIEPTWH